MTVEESTTPIEDAPVRDKLHDKVRDLPELPGVYLFRHASGTVLYVGKSVNLKNRVSTYFHQSAKLGPRISRMVAQVADLEYFVTNNEEEALLLEYEFINRYSPRYNIVFRDDKSYPYVKVTDEEYPRIFFTRKPQEGKGLVLGPYPNSDSLRKTLRFMRTIFPVRSCRVPSSRIHKLRACLEFHIKRCRAPCEQRIDATEYRKVIDQAILFLKGRDEELTGQLRSQMKEAAATWDLEKAARIKQQLTALERVFVKQGISSVREEDLDVVALAGGPDDSVVKAGPLCHEVAPLCHEVAPLCDESCVLEPGPKDVANESEALKSKDSSPETNRTGSGRWVIQQLHIRNGRIQGQRKMVLKRVLGTPSEILTQFIQQHYLGLDLLPTELLVQERLPEQELISRVLSKRAGRRVEIVVPQRGRKRHLVDLAARNAQLYWASQSAVREESKEALSDLARMLDLDRDPSRIECFDISHTGGQETVASLVTATNGAMDRSGYRRFRVKSVSGIDDFASVREIIGRRYSRILAEGQPLPDLVLIDGGKGQLAVAKEALLGLGLGSLPVASLAKREETLFSGNHPDGIRLECGSPVRNLLQRVRDEAHRFAITYHRHLRSARTTTSELDGIHGVGPMSRQLLLSHFGDIEKIKTATLEQLERVHGLNRRAAMAVHAYYRQKSR